MSVQSQTPARREIGFGVRFALSMVAVVAIVWISLGGAWPAIARMFAEGRLHGPDLALFASQSTAVKIHLVGALFAIMLGGVLMAVRKGRTFHRVAGWVWVSLVAVTAGSTIFITSLNNGSWSFLHLFTGWVLLGLPLAVMWAKRHDIKRHRGMMMGLFYGGFAINFFIAMIPGRLLWQMMFG